jgi:hypothetical protein
MLKPSRVTDFELDNCMRFYMCIHGYLVRQRSFPFYYIYTHLGSGKVNPGPGQTHLVVNRNW